MALLTMHNVSKTYPGNVRAVDNFSLSVNEGDFIVLVGPSGCGKTTMLRMIAGLESIDEGSIKLDDVDITNLDPKKRGISMIFQDYALYPHLTVYKNIEFPLRMHRYSKPDRKRLIEEISQSLHIDEVLERRPGALSGGQRQRVAIARALVREPRICLMDEPFSNLDAQLRVQMRSELARFYREQGMTIVFVTHDQTEAMALGTTIVVMKDGVILQAASSKDLYLNPANLFVARFFGSHPMNIYPAELVLTEGEWSALLTLGTDSLEEKHFSIKLDSASYSFFDEKMNGSQVFLGIRPEHVRLATKEDTDDFFINADIQRVEEFGTEGYLYATFFDLPLVVRVSQNSDFVSGSSVKLAFNPRDCYFFDAQTENNLLLDY